MTERISAMLTVTIFVGVVLGLGWFVVTSSTPARHATKPDLATETSEHLVRLSEELASLRSTLEDRGVSGPGRSREAMELGPGEIPVTWTSRELPIDSPSSDVWSEAESVVVPLQAQVEAMPVLNEATIFELEVQGLTNGRQIAWRLSWADSTQDNYLDTDRFCDAVAIQFPLIPNATYKMGDRDFPVQIIQWKAIWQKDVDEGFQDVQDLHPNYWADLYWFAEGEFPYRVPEAFTSSEALDYFVSYRAGNPMANMYRKQPVQEMLAEGFSTLTNQESSVTVGRGEWSNGKWRVVFGRPLETTDPGDYQFEPGVKAVVAFAVWDGATENVSGRKHHSQWVAFQVQP